MVVYLIGLSLSKIPTVQNWTAEIISKSLTDYIGTTVNIGHVQPGLFNRLIIDDVKIFDKNDSLMLSAARIAAKIRIMPLFEKKVHIDNAQIIGAHITLYKKDTNSQLNCHYLIDKFRKENGIQCTMHQLRHSYATMLHSAGVDAKDAQQRLGHSSVIITQDIYTDIESKHRKRVADKIEEYVQKERLLSNVLSEPAND